MIEFILNGSPVQTDVESDTPLLWVIRDSFKLKGSKFGCGMAQCGACTLHIDGRAQRSCVMPVAAVAGRSITTIEGLGTPENPHPLQQAWADQSVPQCGYCQSGQIMSAASLLNENPNPTESEVETAMAGNICRCGCYPRIKAAILTVAETSQAGAVQLATPVTAVESTGASEGLSS